jgi:hypothetical protein
VSDEPTMIICSRADRPLPVMGSVKVDAPCGHQVWVAPSGQRVITETGARPVCQECAIEQLRADREAKVLQPTREQIDELAREFLRRRMTQ